MKKVQDQALKYGLFIGDRGLIKCKNCGLMEDVTIGSILIVYKSEDLEQYFSNNGTYPQDTGLRFIPLDSNNNLFKCPLCNTENEPEEF